MKINRQKIKTIGNILINFFIIFSFIYSILTIVKIISLPYLLDFAFYYQALQPDLGSYNPYNNGKFVLNYPPTAFLFFLPFSLIPYRIAEIIWTLLSYFALLGSIYFLLKSINKRVSIFIYLLIYSLAFLSFPIKFNLGMGQVNFFILLFLCLNFFFYQKKRPYISGMFLAFAIAVKLTPMFLLLFFLKKRNFKIIFSTIATIIVLGIAAAVLFGENLMGIYFFEVFPKIPTIGNDVYYNQALTGLLARVHLLPYFSFVINYLSFIVLMGVSFMLVKSHKQAPLVELIKYSLFIVAVLIGGGLAWQHHLALLIIPYTALTILLIKSKVKLSRLFFLFISYLLVSLNIKNPQLFLGFSVFILSHALYGLVILYLLLLSSVANLKFFKLEVKSILKLKKMVFR